MSDHGDERPLGPSLLGSAAQHAVRVIASALLDDVIAAHVRFEDGEADAGPRRGALEQCQLRI